MDTRRDFIKKAAMLSGAAGLSALLPASVLRAMSINPDPGTTYLDAEHIVVLMQENRSFDHCFGTLQGVRGFEDPRAITLPSGNPVWFQQNATGNTFVPFRLNLNDTKATWIGSLPHSWTNQVDARNNGNHDKWLDVKGSGYKGFEQAPLTLGYYNREDLPFYYALADAFTVCDQNFCSSLTGTTPNRLYLWTGTLRDNIRTDFALVRNENLDYEREASWQTFPEVLEDNGISWKIYQNEISLASGLEGEEDSWLANFTDNPIEWFSQYKVRFSKTHRDYIARRIKELPAEIAKLEAEAPKLTAGSKAAKDNDAQLRRKKTQLGKMTADSLVYTEENFNKLSAREQKIHQQAFTTNKNDPDYRTLADFTYKDGNEKRTLKIPKSDTLSQFRTDVHSGKLPTISWLVAPENYSDHPSAPWYGSWYVSEVMDILTKDPEVWKKTIFVLCYDENDGYFDHSPPFVVPHPTRENTGKVSQGIDVATEYVLLEQDKKYNSAKDSRESPIGLGYRVPLVIASPWSRGGVVCSEVFDHTSILQLMENFLSHKTGKTIRENNISEWRRTVCGDLSSAFQAYNGDDIDFPESLNKEKVIANIHKAQFKKDPGGFSPIAASQIKSTTLPRQEKGIRRAAALSYELQANGRFNHKKAQFELTLAADTFIFGDKSLGAPFVVYGNQPTPRNYTVKAGDKLKDTWSMDKEKGMPYHLEVHGPNGFFRKFKGNDKDPQLNISMAYIAGKNNSAQSKIILAITAEDGSTPRKIFVTDNAYKTRQQVLTLEGNDTLEVEIDLKNSRNWYDFSITADRNAIFEHRYAGKVETGKPGYTDPLIGQV